MKVAYILTEFPALSEPFVATECDLIARHGIEVVPFSFRSPRLETHFDATLSRWNERTIRPSPLSPFNLIRTAASTPTKAMALFKNLARYQASEFREGAGLWAASAWCATVARAIRAQNIQHIHAHFARGAATLAWLVSELADTSFSFTAHAFGVYRSHPDALADKVNRARFVRASHKALVPHLNSAGDVIVVPTALDLDALPYREPPVRNTPLRLTTVARNVPKKGLDLLPPLHRALSERGIANEIQIIGPGHAPGTVAEGVRHLGPLSRSLVLQHMVESDAFVLPCRVDDNGDRDGLPYALLEAFALGVPAVSTTVAGIPELFQGELQAQLCEPDDVQALGESIASLAIDAGHSKRCQIARRQRTIVETQFGVAALAPLARSFKLAANPQE